MRGTGRALRPLGGLVALVTFAAACSDPGSPGDHEPEPSLGIVTGLTVAPDTIPRGGATTIRIIVSNLGDDTHELFFPDGHPYGVEVTGTEGPSAWFPCNVDSSAGARLNILPGTVRAAYLPFDQRWNPRWCPPEGSGALPAGTYTVRGGLNGYEEEHAWGEDLLIIME